MMTMKAFCKKYKLTKAMCYRLASANALPVAIKVDGVACISDEDLAKWEKVYSCYDEAFYRRG
jgi:hypothetical protein